MTGEPTHDRAFPPTHPRRMPADPRHPRTAQAYTRADAIADGLLVQVPRTLLELYRLPWPLAITSAVWTDAIAWPDTAHTARPGTPRHHESAEGRLADVLFLTTTTHQVARPGRTAHPFTLWRIPPNQPTHHPRPLRLTLTVHPDDDAADRVDVVATLAHTPHRPPWWRRRPGR